MMNEKKGESHMSTRQRISFSQFKEEALENSKVREEYENFNKNMS